MLATLIIVMVAALVMSGCAQVHQTAMPLKCVDRPASQLLPGEASFNSFVFVDASTSKIPLISAPHRTTVHCDEKGMLRYDLETPVDTGLSQLSTPLSTAAGHLTYAP